MLFYGVSSFTRVDCVAGPETSRYGSRPPSFDFTTICVACGSCGGHICSSYTRSLLKTCVFCVVCGVVLFFDKLCFWPSASASWALMIGVRVWGWHYVCKRQSLTHCGQCVLMEELFFYNTHHLLPPFVFDDLCYVFALTFPCEGPQHLILTLNTSVIGCRRW